MTDEERNQRFDAKKREVAIMLTGIDPWSKEVKDAAEDAWASEVRVIDPQWGKKNAVSWMERVRITEPMNNDIDGINRYDPKASDKRTSIEPDWLRGCRLAK